MVQDELAKRAPLPYGRGAQEIFAEAKGRDLIPTRRQMVTAVSRNADAGAAAIELFGVDLPNLSSESLSPSWTLSRERLDPA